MIELLISDFDGTLADTFQANFHAYREALRLAGIELKEAEYRNYFGLRFDDFMQRLGITDQDLCKEIREAKSDCYVKFFDLLKVNRPLLDLIRRHHDCGGLTAIASTARRKNLLASLIHIGAMDDFDLIMAGDNAEKGKPDPEIYNKILEHFNLLPTQAIAFEDSQAGIMAAEAAGIPVLRIKPDFFHRL